MDESIEYMQRNPPSYIKRMSVCPDVKLAKTLIGTYGNNSTVFGIQCACGMQRFAIMGKDVGTGYAGVGGSIVIRCAECAQSSLLFDPAQHGYEGALGLADYFDHSKLPDKELMCPKCSKTSFLIAVVLQYSGDEAETIQESEQSLIPEDLFGWIAAQCRCVVCGSEFEMASIECS